MKKLWIILVTPLFLSSRSESFPSDKGTFNKTCRKSSDCKDELLCIRTKQPCHLGNCLCEKHQIYVHNYQKCIPKSPLGKACQTEFDLCPVPNSVCEKKKCVCRKGTKPLKDNLACRDEKIQRIVGESCEKMTDCYTYDKGQLSKIGYCQSSKCSCNENQVKVGTTCKKRLPGDSCSGKCYTSVSYTECKKNKCTCWKNYVYHSTMKKCVFSKTKKLGEKCNITAACVDGLWCSNCPKSRYSICLHSTGAYLFNSVLGWCILFCMILTLV